MASNPRRRNGRRVPRQSPRRVASLSGILIDSNIIIDLLKDHPDAASLVGSEPDIAISIITWLEVLTGVRDALEERVVRILLAEFAIIGLNPEIHERTLIIRRTTRLKLPDAIIFATAQATGRTLYTRNTKDFNPSWTGVSVPYVL